MAVCSKLRRLCARFFRNVLWNPASLLHTFLLGSIYVSLACSRTVLIKLSIRGKQPSRTILTLFWSAHYPWTFWSTFDYVGYVCMSEKFELQAKITIYAQFMLDWNMDSFANFYIFINIFATYMCAAWCSFLCIINFKIFWPVVCLFCEWTNIESVYVSSTLYRGWCMFFSSFMVSYRTIYASFVAS